MAPCDIYLFGIIHLAMKGKRYADVDAIQKASATNKANNFKYYV